MNNPADARWTARHAAAVAEELARTLDRLSASVAGADATTGDVARLAAEDATLLRARVHALMNRVEAATATATAP